MKGGPSCTAGAADGEAVGWLPESLTIQLPYGPATPLGVGAPESRKQSSDTRTACSSHGVGATPGHQRLKGRKCGTGHARASSGDSMRPERDK